MVFVVESEKRGTIPVKEWMREKWKSKTKETEISFSLRFNRFGKKILTKRARGPFAVRCGNASG